jgi:hypothetical protein
MTRTAPGVDNCQAKEEPGQCAATLLPAANAAISAIGHGRMHASEEGSEVGCPECAALVVLALTFPIILAALFFPTPAQDLREQINWGSVFPLHTWKHPPLQTWLPGLVALVSAKNAWPYVLVAQIVNAIGLFYALRIAREFIDRQLVWPVAIAFCVSIPFSGEVLVSALNADQLQGTLWLAVLYHSLRATAKDGWPDWILTGIFAGLAMLTKSFSAVFLAALALASVVQRRDLLVRKKPYVAAAICLLLTAVYAVPAWLDPAAASYGARVFHSLKPHAALSLSRFVGSFIVYLLPPLLALAWLGWLGKLRRRPFAYDGAPWVIMVSTALIVAVLIALLVMGQMKFYMRYNVPLLSLCILLLFSIVAPRPEASGLFARASLAIWVLGAVGGIAYAFTSFDDFLREPADAAAALIRADWERHHHCGPAYVAGEQLSAHAIGLYYGNGVIGLSLLDYRWAHWVNRKRIAELGLVVVADPKRMPMALLGELGAPNSEVTTLRLPLRRTFGRGEHVYQYRFVPPKGC